MRHVETHPFKAFIPTHASVLILGSFPGREQTQGDLDEEQWFYGAKRNQFWRILSAVYKTDLSYKNDKENLLQKYGIGLTDIILKARRKSDSNLDNNLIIEEYNWKVIESILNTSNLKLICFTSRFVESHFIKQFPEVKNTAYLPSPSPRYAGMTLADKIFYYKSVLPK